MGLALKGYSHYHIVVTERTLLDYSPKLVSPLNEWVSGLSLDYTCVSVNMTPAKGICRTN